MTDVAGLLGEMVEMSVKSLWENFYSLVSQNTSEDLFVNSVESIPAYM